MVDDCVKHDPKETGSLLRMELFLCGTVPDGAVDHFKNNFKKIISNLKISNCTLYIMFLCLEFKIVSP